MTTNEGTESGAKLVEEKLDAARESAADRMGRIRERVGDVAESVKTTATSLRDKFRETEWDDVVGNMTSYVRDNPGKSVAVALGLGFVLGLLLRRRGDD